MPRLTQQEWEARFEAARNADEWNALCEELKREYGDYPPWWGDRLYTLAIMREGGLWS